MCIVSMVHDHYDPLIPQPTAVPLPGVSGFVSSWMSSDPAVLAALAEIKALIEAFRADVKRAQELDISMKQPDCVDPEKVKLQERVDELERRLEALENWRRG